MNTNITVITSLIAAIAAIIAPTVSSIITSRNSLKTAKLNACFEKRCKLIQDLNTSYSNMIDQPSFVTYPLDFYATALQLSSLCSKKKTRNAIISLAISVKEKHACPENSKMLEKCMLLLAKEI